MATDYNETKRRGKIINVYYDVEDHGILTVYLTIDFDKGGVQGFGGICLGKDKKDDALAKDYIHDICSLFGVKELKQLVGKKCYALRCFDRLNEEIEGIETENGKRFTHTSWRKKHFKDVESPRQARIKRLLSEIKWAEERQIRAENELKTVDKEYIDWG